MKGIPAKKVDNKDDVVPIPPAVEGIINGLLTTKSENIQKNYLISLNYILDYINKAIEKFNEEKEKRERFLKGKIEKKDNFFNLDRSEGRIVMKEAA